MNISALKLPQEIIDDNAEFIVEMKFNDDKLIADNRFFSDFAVSIKAHILKNDLYYFCDSDNETIYFYGKDNQTDFTNIWSVIFEIYRTEWIKQYISVYKWYSLSEIELGEEVEDVLEVFRRRGV